jgi:RND family efflux transporter MFP subunit
VDKKKRKWLIGGAAIFIAIVLVAVAGWLGLSYFKRPHVKVVKARKMNLPVTIEETGKVVAANRVKVLSLVQSRVVKVLVSEGDEVKKGQLLTKLDEGELKLELEQAQAAYDANVAIRDKIKNSLEGSSSSTETTSYTQQDLDAAESQVKQAQAALKLAQANLAKAKVKSPIDGVVVEVKVNLGDNVAPGTHLLTVIDPDSYVLRVNLSQTQVTWVEEGTNGALQLDAYPGKNYSGKVTKVSLTPITQGKEQLYPVDIRIRGIKSELLREGLSGQVSLNAGKVEQVLAVPIEAVFGGENKSTVFVVSEEDNITQSREVKLGYTTEDFVEIKKGLSVGELVVVEGGESLSDGDRVIWQIQ